MARRANASRGIAITSFRLVVSSIAWNEDLITLSSPGTGVSSNETPCSNATWRTRCAFDLSATIPAGLSLALFMIGILQTASRQCRYLPPSIGQSPTVFGPALAFRDRQNFAGQTVPSRQKRLGQ
jgi:hypothetical protein